MCIWFLFCFCFWLLLLIPIPSLILWIWFQFWLRFRFWLDSARQMFYVISRSSFIGISNGNFVRVSSSNIFLTTFDMGNFFSEIIKRCYYVANMTISSGIIWFPKQENLMLPIIKQSFVFVIVSINANLIFMLKRIEIVATCIRLIK